MTSLSGVQPCYCRCAKPSRQVAEGVEYCADCGERIPDPLLVAMWGELRALRRQLDSLGGAKNTPEPELVDAAWIAKRYSVARDWVYANKARLGGIPLGSGERPRWRFDPEHVARVMKADAPKSEAVRVQPRPRRRAPTGDLLPVAGSVP